MHELLARRRSADEDGTLLDLGVDSRPGTGCDVIYRYDGGGSR